MTPRAQRVLILALSVVVAASLGFLFGAAVGDGPGVADRSGTVTTEADRSTTSPENGTVDVGTPRTTDRDTTDPDSTQESTSARTTTERRTEDDEDEETDTSSPDPTPIDAPTGTADTSAVSCPSGAEQVTDAESLSAALAAAEPGAVIELADGTYIGEFVATVSGTTAQPIWLCGGVGAVIDGGSVKGGYAVHLDGARHWRLVGFTVRNAQKGVMVDGSTDTVIQGLTVTEIGDEAIHLRSGTTFSVVRDNTISGTGMRRDKFGEGIYIGTATSNWCTYSACGPDPSNNNAIVGNRISGTSAEAIDIKEGTQNGVIQDNTFDGTGGLTGADSWVDVKGNGWTVIGNSGRNSPVDGFQVHSVVDGWGTDNVFIANTAEVNGSGFGFSLTPVQDNLVHCDNSSSGAASGLTNTDCT